MMYKERLWEYRIFKAGGIEEKPKHDRILYELYTVLGFSIGILVSHLIYINIDLILDFIEPFF